MDANDRFPEDAAEIGFSLEPVAPRPELRARLMAKIKANPQFTPESLVRADEGKWTPIGVPGVAIKPLFRDPQSKLTTMLVRMDPGASLPSHHHGDAEQCLVLEGDVQWRDQVYTKGDFIVAGKESVHPAIRTVNGNLLLIISGHNEFIAA